MSKLKKVKVSIQGHEYSYHDKAATLYFKDSYTPVYCESFSDTLEALWSNRADYAVMAIENSLYGSIAQVYDLISIHTDIKIVGEVYLGINHMLMANEGTSLEDITIVRSHPVALQQCEASIKKLLPNAAVIAGKDTASCADDLEKSGSTSEAVIAGADVAKQYGLQILARGMEDDSANFTRFLIFHKETSSATGLVNGTNKTSILITQLSDDIDLLSPGTLYNALGCFASNNIALTKIESRPIRGNVWRYIFYIDCLVGLNEPQMQLCLDQLDKLGARLHILGSYKQGVTY